MWEEWLDLWCCTFKKGARLFYFPSDTLDARVQSVMAFCTCRPQKTGEQHIRDSLFDPFFADKDNSSHVFEKLDKLQVSVSFAARERRLCLETSEGNILPWDVFLLQRSEIHCGTSLTKFFIPKMPKTHACSQNVLSGNLSLNAEIAVFMDLKLLLFLKNNFSNANSIRTR